MEEIPPQSTIAPPPSVPPVVTAPAPRSSPLPILFVVLILILLTSTIVFAYQNWQLKQQLNAPTTYEECLKAPGSVLQESYPATCVTRNAKRFKQPLTDEEKKKLEPPDPTTDWKTYTNSIYNYSVKYPSNLTVGENGMGGGDIQKATAIGIYDASTKNLETPRFAITMRSDSGPLENVANKHSQKLITNLLSESEKQTAAKNLGYSISDNKISSPITVATFAGFPSFQFSIKGSTIDDGAAEYGVPEEEHQYIWFEANQRFFLISFTKTDTMSQILSTFKLTDTSVTPTSKPKTIYIVPTSWKRLTTQSGLNLCLPPKWEVEAYDHLIFNRDEGYKPSITYITNLPYSGGSRREAYFAYWVQEYPDVKQLVSVADTEINGNSALTIYPANSSDPKTSPEGLTVVWFSAGKLWKAGLSSWNMINTSQTFFLKDFYTMISCSF